ncbi:MAG: hypothetical protein HeimC3_13860 [Candidatus Heimdallarchaeota archaeon LC_3]|nr:MAG: hypothetical protein HeimC3_13860 [Candidatus Heimdallarchaeota archaeon LC_3]
MSQANIFKFLDRFLPSTAARLYLADIPINITTSSHQLYVETTTLPIVIYFQIDGEFWQIHPLQSYKDIVTPFLLPLRYQYCADFHVILCSVKQYEKYPTEITDIWRKYGYGVIVIDTYSEPPVKLLDYPLCQYVFPEVRRQVLDYVKQTKGIEYFREPFWIKNVNLKEKSYAPSPELVSLIKVQEKADSVSIEENYYEQEAREYEDLHSRLQKNKNTTFLEQQGFLLYTFKRIVSKLKLLLNIEDSSHTESMLLIDDAYNKEIITEDMKDILHAIRMERNKYSHKTSLKRPLSYKDLVAWYKVMKELEKIIPKNDLTKSIPESEISPKPKLTKTMMTKLPKQESKKLAYGLMKKQLESKSPEMIQTTQYNSFITKILDKYKINLANNPKIISVILADRIGREIDTDKLTLEIENCCKDIEPNKKNYPLLTSLGG